MVHTDDPKVFSDATDCSERTFHYVKSRLCKHDGQVVRVSQRAREHHSAANVRRRARCTRHHDTQCRPDCHVHARRGGHGQQAREVLKSVEDEWEELTGRRYGPVEAYRTDDADLLLVTSGTITSTARHVADERRPAGEAA